MSKKKALRTRFVLERVFNGKNGLVGLFLRVDRLCRKCKGLGFVVSSWCDSKSAFDRCSVDCCVGVIECQCTYKYLKSIKKVNKNLKLGSYKPFMTDQIQQLKLELKLKKKKTTEEMTQDLQNTINYLYK